MKLAGSLALSFHADCRIPDAVVDEIMESITDQIDWQIKIITCAIQHELDRCSQEWLAQNSNTTKLEKVVINQAISIIDSLREE